MFRRITNLKIHNAVNAGILLVHLLALYEFILHPFGHIATEGWVAVAFTGIIFLYWTIVADTLFRQERKRLRAENEKQNSEIEDLKATIRGLQFHERYSKVYKEFAEAFSLIHDLHRFLVTHPPTGNRESDLDTQARAWVYLENFCNQITYAFEQITGKEISTCIKLITGDPKKETSEASTVRTMVRSQRDRSLRTRDLNVHHHVKKNTSYKHVIKNAKKHDNQRAFFSNNLPLLRGYENTSFTIDEQEIYSDDCSDEYRIAKWKLPYRSTIVGGIYPNTPEYKKSQFIGGFVCIDSNAMDIFNEERDTHLINTLGDGLYNVIKQLRLFPNDLSKKRKNEKSSV